MIDGSENAPVGGDLNFGFRMLLKGAVNSSKQLTATAHGLIFGRAYYWKDICV